APCQAACPTGIPAQDRWAMVRADNIDEAISMGLNHSPFPATVCGYLCPSPCMDACTRGRENLAPIDVRALGRAGEGAAPPTPAPKTPHRMAVIGGGPGGLSAAWHLSLSGHGVSVFETGDKIGGKMSSVIPGSRIPQQTLEAELDRVRSVVEDIRLDQSMDAEEFDRIREAHDFVIIAAGAKKPRTLPIPGIDQAFFANDFLEKAKADALLPGGRVVIIGAGNVGCDVATEAHRLGAREITPIDVQKPAAFGKEREDAEACGAQFKWPVFTDRITEEGVVLKDGSLLEADTVVLAIGDVPDLSFVKDLALDNGFLAVDALGRTSDPKVFAVGDVVGPGLITHAVGAGKGVATAIDQILSGGAPQPEKPVIDKERITLSYYDPRGSGEGVESSGDQCASCGKCRDCGICVSVCPEGAISRQALGNKEFEYRVDPDKCIGCGFCKGACPCGIWDLVPNTPL
ncbi:MAG: FAD-dependent oxidoreductase, partial [Desulfovibrionales bacterium]|nr:FAD-dependent oxidoreductase [Desulfovibrionales bacterium]